MDVRPQQVFISAQSLAHMRAVDLRAIADSADYADATRAAAVTELAGRGANTNGTLADVRQTPHGAPVEANQGSIIPDEWIKWALGEEPRMTGRDDTEG